MAFEFDSPGKQSAKTEPGYSKEEKKAMLEKVERNVKPSTMGRIEIDKVRPNLHAGKVAKWNKKSDKEILEEAHKKYL